MLTDPAAMPKRLSIYSSWKVIVYHPPLGQLKVTFFKLGDRVKYSCSSSGDLYQTFSTRSSPNGSQGKVALLFDDPRPKIGLRFDKPIPDGVDLGGACEGGHGFFCSDTDLRLENSGIQELDKLLISALFEVVLCESRDTPFILFMKDAEKSIIGNGDPYAFKSKLELLPDNVVVIGSHTHAESRKEKSHPGSLLFTKFSSNKAALLDFAFPVLEERNRTGSEQAASTSGTSLRHYKVITEDLCRAILEAKEIVVSFDNFPYYLSKNTKNVLIATCFKHLKHNLQMHYTRDVTNSNPRILLSGPAGSEIYQEMLTKALAKYSGAKLLIFDSHFLLGGLFSKEAELLKEGLNGDRSCRYATQSESLLKLESDSLPSISGTAKSKKVTFLN